MPLYPPRTACERDFLGLRKSTSATIAFRRTQPLQKGTQSEISSIIALVAEFSRLSSFSVPTPMMRGIAMTRSQHLLSADSYPCTVFADHLLYGIVADSKVFGRADIFLNHVSTSLSLTHDLWPLLPARYVGAISSLNYHYRHGWYSWCAAIWSNTGTWAWHVS